MMISDDWSPAPGLWTQTVTLELGWSIAATGVELAHTAVTLHIWPLIGCWAQCWALIGPLLAPLTSLGVRGRGRAEAGVLRMMEAGAATLRQRRERPEAEIEVTNQTVFSTFNTLSFLQAYKQ